MSSRYWYLFPSFLWSCVICYVTLIPGNDVPNVSLNDKLIHAGVFAGLFVLSYWGLIKGGFRNPMLRSLIFTFALGVTTECLQLYIPGRSFSVYDLIANVAGIAIPAIAIPFMPFPKR